MSVVLLARGVAGVLEWYAPQRPDAGPTVEIRNRQGGIVVAQTATGVSLDSVDTTLAQGAAVGAEQLELASGAGLVAGRQYYVSGQGARGERVELEQYSGVTAYLRGRTAYPHPTGCDFEGTRISYSYTPATGQRPEHGWRATFGWAVAGVAQQPGVVEFGIVQHPIRNEWGPPLLYGALPQLDDYLHEDTDVGQKVQDAWDETVEWLLAEGLDPSWVVGGGKFKRAVRYLGLYLCAEQYGSEFADERKEWRERYRECLDVLKSIAAVDADQDGAVEASEGGFSGGFLYRGG